MTIEPKIAKYIDLSIRRSDERIAGYISKINKENVGYMDALKEYFQGEVKMLAELVQDRPTRDEVRAIAREEIDESLRPVNAKLDFLNEERKEMIHALREIKA